MPLPDAPARNDAARGLRDGTVDPIALAPGEEAHLVVLHDHGRLGILPPAARAMDRGRDHLPVARIPLAGGFGERDLSRAFTATNSIESPWYENPKAHPLVADVRSTSVGDVAVLEVDGEPRAAFQVMPLGWAKLDEVPDYLTEKARRGLFAEKLGLAGGEAAKALEAVAPSVNKDGYLPLWVRKDDLDGKGRGPTAEFVSTFKDAIAQPLYANDPETWKTVATGARAHGAAGVEALKRTFGQSQYRSMQFDAGTIAAKTIEDAGRARTVLAAVGVNKERSAEIKDARAAAREHRKAPPRRGPVDVHEMF